jgi:cytoskeleton protein RodZ
MTEQHRAKDEATAESTQATPGQELEKGRKAMGLTQQQVADRLHLRLGDIQDIENDTHKPGVSMTFTKGYVRMYAKLLGIPVDPLLDGFDVLHRGEKDTAKLQSFSQRVAKEANDDRWMMVTYLIIFLVVASLVIWWYQQSDKSIMNRLNLFNDNATEQSQGGDISEGESISVMGQLPVELTIPEEDIKSQDQLNVESDNTALEDAISDANDSVEDPNIDLDDLDTAFVEDNSTSVDDLTNSANSEINSKYTVNDDGTVDVVFTFKEDCWLSVTDVNEETMALGVKVKGRVMSVNGVPPILVNMCPPQNVAIDFAGAPVDLSIYPRGNPVKFELSVTGE